MVSTEVKLWFLSSFEHFWPNPQDTLSEVALFLEKMHKIFKNKAQGCSTPLSLIKYVPNVGYFHLTYSTMFTKWSKVGMSDMQEWTEAVLESNKTLFLFFLYVYVQILSQGQKAVLTIVEFEFFGIF